MKHILLISALFLSLTANCQVVLVGTSGGGASPNVTAGDSLTTSDATVSLKGVITGSPTDYYWVHNGLGTIADSSKLNTTYTVHANDTVIWFDLVSFFNFSGVLDTAYDRRVVNVVSVRAGADSKHINYLNIAYDSVPDNWLDSIQQNLVVYYPHDSHGDRILDGLEAIQVYDETFASNFDWSVDGAGGTLKLIEPAQVYPPEIDPYWADATRTYLDANTDVNVVVYGLSYNSVTAGGNGGIVDGWQNAMNATMAIDTLSTEYPDVTFVISTPMVHARRPITNGYYYPGNPDPYDYGLYRGDSVYRNFAMANDYWLFDIYDIMSHTPDGTYYGSYNLTDSSYHDYYRMTDDGGVSAFSEDPIVNTSTYISSSYPHQVWATSNPTHTLSLIADECIDCDHAFGTGSNYRSTPDAVNPVICAMKAGAFLQLLAKIAGWGGIEVPVAEAPDTATVFSASSAKRDTITIVASGFDEAADNFILIRKSGSYSTDETDGTVMRNTDNNTLIAGDYFVDTPDDNTIYYVSLFSGTSNVYTEIPNRDTVSVDSVGTAPGTSYALHSVYWINWAHNNYAALLDGLGWGNTIDGDVDTYVMEDTTGTHTITVNIYSAYDGNSDRAFSHNDECIFPDTVMRSYVQAYGNNDWFSITGLTDIDSIYMQITAARDGNAGHLTWARMAESGDSASYNAYNNCTGYAGIGGLVPADDSVSVYFWNPPDNYGHVGVMRVELYVENTIFWWMWLILIGFFWLPTKRLYLKYKT